MLEKMKIALRIKSNALDAEIQSVIGAARLELVRAGVKPEKANADDDDLIISAIRSYVLAQYSADTKLTEGYWKAFAYQLDCLRRSSGYMREAGEAV